ncbi:MAG: glycine cleavage T C-terminal barrel domain-containing protein [SAR202 cluster bacterium]|jgi:folate-binding protein YgfZ|nr:glycine cleavage T C-terminal barrel domain-containing protein [SAR202 cluster bacterium]MDP6514144.1 glycine cleavage T C-terminal barrel domain-containing protein [SAR202 cluster bacterium]
MALAESRPSSEIESATSHAALIDRSDVGRLRVSGDDATDLLNRLSTNNLELLTPGQGMNTVLTTAKGRIIDLLSIIPSDDSLLILTSPGRQQQVADWIEFYTFIEDVTVQNITDDTAMLAIVGPESAEAIQQAIGVSVDQLELHSPIAVDALDNSTLVRTDHFNLPTFELIANFQAKEQVISAFNNLGVSVVSNSVSENLRIAMAVPAATGELTEDFNPLEAGLRPHISFNKICYIGQEVVSRLNAYEKVQKHLVKLEWNDNGPNPVPGTSLTVDGKDVGQLTSVGAFEDGLGVALGYVRNAHVEAGASVLAESADGEVALTVSRISGEA